MRLAARKPSEHSAPLLVAVVPPTSLPAEPGREEMFSVLYQRAHGPALDHAGRYLSRAEAEDAVQDAFTDIWIRWDRLRPEQRTEKYVLGAVHLIMKEMRKASRALVSLEDADGELARKVIREFELPTRGTTAGDVIDLAVSQMPERRREVFLLVREHAYTYMEVAQMLGVRAGTVNNQMFKAMTQLRALFVQKGFRIKDVDLARLPAATPLEPLVDQPIARGDATHD